jgi:1,4-dihydroxy-2-naphthoate octaprenyltransferase
MAQEDDMMEMPLVVPKVFYMALLVFSIAFYFIWSAMFGTWTDLAVYTVTIILGGLGVVGTLLYTIREREEAGSA